MYRLSFCSQDIPINVFDCVVSSVLALAPFNVMNLILATSETHNLDTMIAVPCNPHLNAQTRLQRYNRCT
jgi:hypothetical protein